MPDSNDLENLVKIERLESFYLSQIRSSLGIISEVKNELESQIELLKAELLEYQKFKSEAKTKFENFEKEISLKNDKIQSLEESNAKYQKFKERRLISKIFDADSENEDFGSLLNLDIEKLFEKYELIMLAKNSKNIKVEFEENCGKKLDFGDVSATNDLDLDLDLDEQDKS